MSYVAHLLVLGKVHKHRHQVGLQILNLMQGDLTCKTWATWVKVGQDRKIQAEEKSVLKTIDQQLCSDDGPCWSETSTNQRYFKYTSPLTPWQDKTFLQNELKQILAQMIN